MTSITTLLGLDPSMGAELAKAQQNGNGDSKSESKPEKMDTTPAPEPAEEKTAFENEAELKQLKRSRQAMEEKQLGNTAYKSKNFETALEHYSKAIELDPSNM